MSASTVRNTPDGCEFGEVLDLNAHLLVDESQLSSLVVAAQAAYAQAEWSLLSANGVTASMGDLKILRGVVDACDAKLRNRGAELQPPPPPPPPGPGPTPPPPAPPEDSGSGDGSGDSSGDGSGDSDVSQTSLDEKSGVGAATGRRRDRHAKVLNHFPSFADALVAGVITESHVAALAEVLFSATEEVWEALRDEETALLTAAGQLGPIPYRKFVTQTTIRVAAALGAPVDRDLSSEISASLWIDKESGLGKLFATFDPSSFAVISAILGKASGKLQFKDRTLTEKQALGKALITMLSKRPGGLGGTTASPEGSSAGSEVKPVVSILIDEKTLVDGPHADTICEYNNGSRLPVDVAREIACNASLTPILRDKWGVVLDLGRESRYATAAQRRAMEAMYATCFHEACDTPITQCHEHHVIYWEHGGPTDMVNLLPVCQTHHRWIHATNPHVSMDEHRTVTVTMSNGTQSVHHLNRQPHRHNHGRDHNSDHTSDHSQNSDRSADPGGPDPSPESDPGFHDHAIPHTEVA
jgi:hypothetical protein